MLLAEEIAEEYEVEGVEVQTPNGWRHITRVYKTIPMAVYELELKDDYALRGSGHHLVKTESGWKTIEDLIPGYDRVYVGEECELKTVVSVLETGEEEPLYDITVNDPSGEFFSNGILSHNSTTMCCRQQVSAHVFPRLSGLYIAPSFPMLETYASRFQEMEGYCRVAIGKQNKYSKRYANGSKIDMAYALESARDVRGKSVDTILIDECQNLNPDILPEIIFTQSLSKLPMTVYAGTALSTDTVLEDKWQLSSMGMWHVRAKDGKHWLNMYDRETLYKVCNNPLGPTCPYTGKILDVTNGCYVHANKKSLDNGDIGLHVPQCIIKDIADDPVQWGKVYKHIQEDDFKKVLQECFGIAVAEGSREITVTDLQNAAVLNLTEEEIKERCRTGFYRPIISGCDWGGSDYNPAAKTKKSYTVHCIIGLAPDGLVDILHYRRHSGMDYTAITGLIMRDHHEFNAKAIASDFGAGAAYNNEIRRYVPIGKHFVMDYVGPASAAMATPKGDHMPNQIALNRTEALTNVFKDLKRGLIRARSWDASGQYLLDWLNMFRVPTETASGKRTFLYRRNPQKSDDALHAFNFAYALMKFYKGESLVEDPAVTRAVNAVLRAVTPLQKQAVARLQQQLSSDIQWVTSID